MGYVENIKSIMQWGNSFERQDRFPLDRTDLHISYDDAVLYAKGDGSDSRGLGTLAYVGQTITVWGLNEKDVEGVWFYSLVPSAEGSGYLADLKPIGSTTTETALKYTDAVELSKKLAVGQLIKVTNDEEVSVDSDSDASKLTYKSGFYIVNSSGSISALDTSTGATDEISDLDTRVSALESNRVLNSDFESYKTNVESTLNSKASVSDLNSVNTTLSDRLDTLEEKDYEQIAVNAAGAAVAAIVAGADSDFDTLKEVADWILNDTIGAAELQTTVSQHTESINAINDELDGKQSVIDDLETIRRGAEAGATALQAIPAEYVTETELEGYGYLTSEDLNYADDSDIDDLFK